MPEGKFPKPAEEIVATLIAILSHAGGRPTLVRVLSAAHPYLEVVNFDNWDGGTYTWALRLEVPAQIFAELKASLQKHEEEVHGELGFLDRLYSNDKIREVTIIPGTPIGGTLGHALAPSEEDVKRLWGQGRFRLFLSHVSLHKVPVEKLKKELELRGIDAFVAHSDIEPSLEWRDEIELALGSMHAIAPLITPEFHASPWTDQEIGWALGRGLLVLPVKLGAVPYGLMGKYQAVGTAPLNQPRALAEAIGTALIKNPQTHVQMRRALVSTFVLSTSYAMTHAILRLLDGVAALTTEEKAALDAACSANDQISAAFGAVSAVQKITGSVPVTVADDGEVPF